MGDLNVLHEVMGMIQAGQNGQIFSALVVAVGVDNTIRIQHPGSSAVDPIAYKVIGGIAPVAGTQIVAVKIGSGLVILNHTGHPIVDVGYPSYYQSLVGDMSLAQGYGWKNVIVGVDSESQQTITNDGTEQQIAFVSVPYQTFTDNGNKRGVWLELGGSYLNNSAATRTLRMKVKLNGNIIWDSTTAALAASAVATAWQMSVMVYVNNVSSQQQMVGQFGMASQTAPAVGQGDLATAPLIPTRPIRGSGTVDLVAGGGGLQLSVTMQHSIGIANLTLTKDFAWGGVF